MQTREWTFRDKAAWGPGPWQDEPDKRQWIDPETGLPCLIVRGPVGALCGYVCVSEGHPLFGVPYSDRAPLPRERLVAMLEARGALDLYESDLDTEEGVDVGALFSVHGGLTFARHCAEGEPDHGICHRPEPGEPDHVWWFGFDCAHCDDYVPGLISDYRDPLGTPTGWGTVIEYRDRAYVEAECASLAKQLAGVAAAS